MIDEFKRMLDAYVAAEAEQREALETELWDRFGRDCAVLISDMSSFSRLTQQFGILHFLTLIRRMETTCAPVIESHGGHVCKTIADNLFATFPTAQAAVDAALELHARFEEDGRERPEGERVRLAIGIDAGRILDIGGLDMYGSAVNVASKLGEDLAIKAETLVTQRAIEHSNFLPPETAEHMVARISDIEIRYLRLPMTELSKEANA